MSAKKCIPLVICLVSMTGLWTLAKVAAAEHAGVSPAQSASSTVNSPVEDALEHFDLWAAQQELYSPVMIGDMRQRLQARFVASSPDGHSELRDEILQRLDVFQEPLSQDTANWVLQTLAVASDSYATKLRAQLPDPVDDGVDTMRAKFRALMLSRVGLQRYRAGFDQTRQAAVASVQNDAHQQAAINSQLRAGMTFSSPNLYTPGANRIDASARYRGYTTHRYANPYPFGGVWFF